MKIKPLTFTLTQLSDAMESSNGFCLACGEEAQQVEPDAERYDCPSCGEPQVFGAEEILLMGLIKDEAL